MNNKIRHKHIWLYAKYWYKISDDVFEDLRTILKRDINIGYISDELITKTLIGLAVDALENFYANPWYRLTKMLESTSIHPFYSEILKTDNNKLMVTNCLSVMSIAVTGQICKPDYSILPRNEFMIP